MQHLLFQRSDLDYFLAFFNLLWLTYNVWNRIEILIENIYDKTVDCDIPMLSIIDDGVGMNHQEILRMISLGHKQPDEDNLDRIGRFGVGFKVNFHQPFFFFNNSCLNNRFGNKM